MAQLKMYWFPGTPIDDAPLPDGFAFSNYQCEADKDAWVEICKNGLVGDDADASAFDGAILDREDVDPFKDVFFLDYNGEHIGTFTAYIHKDEQVGDFHMVALRTDFRGRGLSKYLSAAACKKLEAEQCRFILLTTDEWRKGAVKSYLTAGFKPVEYDLNMENRWNAVLEEYGIDSVEMVYEDGTPYKIIHRKGLTRKIRFGVFGGARGKTFMQYCKEFDDAELVAVCDANEARFHEIREKFDCSGVTFYKDFDAFLAHDMDAICLANYANEHAPYAIRAMRAGKHVLSEVLPVQTMKEAVELIETVEETGMTYAYAENYCYMPAPKTMRQLCREGALGSFEYGEGEYLHNCEYGWPG
ncbi:MAG: GNAT family N-acetyltransferase, partial [Clostridia bacterium]|nr:GNAT family N-acetyltransferase [Clostridia bacterium]